MNKLWGAKDKREQIMKDNKDLIQFKSKWILSPSAELSLQKKGNKAPKRHVFHKHNVTHKHIFN